MDGENIMESSYREDASVPNEFKRLVAHGSVLRFRAFGFGGSGKVLVDTGSRLKKPNKWYIISSRLMDLSYPETTSQLPQDPVIFSYIG
jgi:hypothetical protein